MSNFLHAKKYLSFSMNSDGIEEKSCFLRIRGEHHHKSYKGLVFGVEMGDGLSIIPLDTEHPDNLDNVSRRLAESRVLKVNVFPREREESERVVDPITYNYVLSGPIGKGLGVPPFERGLKAPDVMSYSPQAMKHWRYRPDNGYILSGISFIERRGSSNGLTEKIANYEDDGVSCPDGFTQRR